ncbi:MAG: hypothetical protein JSR58_07930 [Verrucomicrobia bacterium]|nr:hypothetical protein [Verrucomicrobiota bacterium]
MIPILCALLFGANVEGERAGELRVVPVDATAEPDEVRTLIVFPKEGDTTNESVPTLQLRLEGYALGVISDFPRQREIRNRGQGQTLQILIDDRAPIEINDALYDTADREEIDYDQTIRIKCPYKLSPGMHIIRAYPQRSFDESLKGDGTFASSYFYVSKGKGVPDLSRPYLTYNMPRGEYAYDKPILLDFLIANTQLSKDGYKVRLTIDKNKRMLTQWIPYYIYGLGKGTHTIQLELLDPTDKVIPGLFPGDGKQTIRVN